MNLKFQIIAVFLIIIFMGGCNSLKNGFVKEADGHTYYYVYGEKKTGWQEIDGDWYYFYVLDDTVSDEEAKVLYQTYPKGHMFEDIFFEPEDGRRYYLQKNGKMLRNGFKDSYYYGDDGLALHDTQMEINGKIYSFDSNGIATELPHYSFPALGRGNYDFYFKQNYPLTLKNRDQTYIIAERPTVEVYGGNNNSAFISGVISLRAKDNESHVAWINCRLSTTDADGITSSAEEAIKFSSIKNGEKTRFTVTFKNTLPLNGVKININFEN